MKLFIVSVLTYALVAQASVLPLIPHVGKLGHAVAAGVANSVGITAAAGIHAAVHGAEQVGAAVVGTGLETLELGSGVVSGIKDGISSGIHGLGLGSDKQIGTAVVGTHLEALELGSGVVSGIKDDISNGIHGLGLGSDKRIGRPQIFDQPESPWKEGATDFIKEHGGDISEKLHQHFDFHKGDELNEGFDYASHNHKEHDSHEHKEHDSHEHKEHKRGKHHDCHKRDKRGSHQHRKET